jgi:hypothetical protein
MYYYPFHIITVESWVEYFLALLRSVAIGDFRSPEMIGGYQKGFSYERVDIREK